METKRKLKELKANMPYDFYEKLLAYSRKLGLTERQFTAVCISLGFNILLGSYLNNLSGFIESETVSMETTLKTILDKRA